MPLITYLLWHNHGAREEMVSYLSFTEFQICPSLDHAGLVLINSLLDTIPGKLQSFPNTL